MKTTNKHRIQAGINAHSGTLQCLSSHHRKIQNMKLLEGGASGVLASASGFLSAGQSSFIPPMSILFGGLCVTQSINSLQAFAQASDHNKAKHAYANMAGILFSAHQNVDDDTLTSPDIHGATKNIFVSNSESQRVLLARQSRFVRDDMSSILSDIVEAQRIRQAHSLAGEQVEIQETLSAMEEILEAINECIASGDATCEPEDIQMQSANR